MEQTKDIIKLDLETAIALPFSTYYQLPDAITKDFWNSLTPEQKQEFGKEINKKYQKIKEVAVEWLDQNESSWHWDDSTSHFALDISEEEVPDEVKEFIFITNKSQDSYQNFKDLRKNMGLK